MFKKIKNCKKLIILFSALLLIVGIVGTYMWDMHEIDVENILQSRTVEVVIDENFPNEEITTGDITKEVEFNNTGTASVFLRFTYAQYWQRGNELLENYTDTTTLNWADNVFENWYDGGDGWYYYEYVVSADESVDILESVTFAEILPENANYNLFFQVETVQVSDESSVNADATYKLFGVKGTINNPTIVDGAVTSAEVTWGDIND
ncbi:MAG: hypothetical protein R3Y33_01965 [Clostridia bacterium]